MFAATIGFFDGVHKGHQFLISRLQEEAQRRGMPTMVITFAQHPREVVCQGWHPQLLTTPEEKEALLRQAGIDQLTVLPFDKAMSQLSAMQFMGQVLHNQLQAGLLLTGYDNRFGHRTKGLEEGFNQYVDYGRQMGIEVIGGQPLGSEDGRCYSSSLVRRLLSEGDVAAAQGCLGRPYQLKGSVVHGEQIGRQIGFPTANISPSHPHKLIPREGVYAVRVNMLDAHHPALTGTTFRGMMNIGCRPTFNGHQRTLEVHIFNFDGDLYGREVNVSFIARLRDERHFDSPEQLIHQMHDDALQADQVLYSPDNPTTPL